MFRSTNNRILFITLLIVCSMHTSVLSHAHLQSSIPESDATVTNQMVDSVQINFTEPVHVNQSVFRVYALEEEDDPIRLKAKASELIAEVLQAATRRQPYDESNRADVGIDESRNTAAQVKIHLKDDLTPGPYAVMWRVRSIDTHVTDGFFVFTYSPAE